MFPACSKAPYHETSTIFILLLTETNRQKKNEIIFIAFPKTWLNTSFRSYMAIQMKSLALFLAKTSTREIFLNGIFSSIFGYSRVKVSMKYEVFFFYTSALLANMKLHFSYAFFFSFPRKKSMTFQIMGFRYN